MNVTLQIIQTLFIVFTTLEKFCNAAVAVRVPLAFCDYVCKKFPFEFVKIQSNLALRTFSVRGILVLKVKIVLILTVIYYINHQLVIGDLVLKVKQVLILTVLKAKFDCTFLLQIQSYQIFFGFVSDYS